MRRSAPTSTELRIVAGLRRGDPEAVRALQAEYGASALALLRAQIGDRCAVEDVYQQVLLEAWQRSPTYDPERASLRTWLATIARSRAIDHLRRRVPEPCDPIDTCRERACESESTGALVDRLTLEAMLSRLSRQEAAILRLQYHLGLSQRQIVAQTGLPLGTVKSRTASALRRMRRMLDDEHPPL